MLIFQGYTITIMVTLCKQCIKKKKKKLQNIDFRDIQESLANVHRGLKKTMIQWLKAMSLKSDTPGFLGCNISTCKIGKLLNLFKP